MFILLKNVLIISFFIIYYNIKKKILKNFIIPVYSTDKYLTIIFFSYFELLIYLFMNVYFVIITRP